jgi:hypothetical protein
MAWRLFATMLERAETTEAVGLNWARLHSTRPQFVRDIIFSLHSAPSGNYRGRSRQPLTSMRVSAAERKRKIFSFPGGVHVGFRAEQDRGMWSGPPRPLDRWGPVAGSAPPAGEPSGVEPVSALPAIVLALELARSQRLTQRRGGPHALCGSSNCSTRSSRSSGPRN